MTPVPLSGTPHQEETARFQCQPNDWLLLIRFMLEDKFSRRAKRERSDGRLWTEFSFVVAVEAHAISMVAVHVQKHTVEI